GAVIQVPNYAPQAQFPGTAYKPQPRRPDQTADQWYEQKMRNSGSRIEGPEWQKKELERRQDERMAEINADPLLKARASHPKTKEQIALIEAADKAERERFAKIREDQERELKAARERRPSQQRELSAAADREIEALNR